MKLVNSFKITIIEYSIKILFYQYFTFHLSIKLKSYKQFLKIKNKNFTKTLID